MELKVRQVSWLVCVLAKLMVVGSSPTLDVSFSAFSQASSDDALPTQMSS